MASETRELDLTGVTAVEVAAFNGDVIVEAGEAGGEPGRLEATLRGKATYEVERVGTLLYVAAKKRGLTYLGSAAGFRLRLPPGLALKLATVNGAIRAHGPARSVVANTYNGEVAIQGTGGEVRVSAAGGQITVRGAAGRVKVSTSNGAVQVAEVRGSVEVNTANGSVRVASTEGQVRVATSNGEVRVEDAAGEVQVATSNGGVRLERVTLAPGTKSWAKTSAGAVEVLGLHAPGGLTLSAKTAGGIHADLPGYDVKSQSRYALKARLPGARPASLDLANAGGIRITAG